MASGFPVGMGGSGCTCGAVVGGIMAIGMFFGRVQAKDSKVQKQCNWQRNCTIFSSSVILAYAVEY